MPSDSSLQAEGQMTEEMDGLIRKAVQSAIGQRFGQVVVKVAEGKVTDIEVTARVHRDLLKKANGEK